MAEKWNTTIGSLSNQVAQDIPDIGENFDYLMARNGYLVDAGQTNQGAVGDGSGYTIKDIVDLVGATKKATIFLPHHAADDNTTVYSLGTDETIVVFHFSAIYYPLNTIRPLKRFARPARVSVCVSPAVILIYIAAV